MSFAAIGRSDLGFGPRILTRDELAVDNHVGLKIWPNDYLASYEAADCSELPAKLASAICSRWGCTLTSRVRGSTTRAGSD